jgi:DNA-binding SARP family transcriptional activator
MVVGGQTAPQAMPTATKAQADSPSDACAPLRPLEQEAFQRFPYSLIVVDRKGRIVACNLAGRDLIEAMGMTDMELTCCMLLGCRSSDSVLADTCLTALARGTRSALPEVRVDVPTADGVRAMWVAAAPLDEDSSHVVLQLRPGISQDRRRRTDPHWMTGPRLRICALGGTVVESAEGSIGGEWLDQRTGQLLKYLIAERNRAVHIDEIGESIWPGADFAIAGSVRYYIHALRRKLEPQRGRREPSAFIASSAGSYRLNLDNIAVDADEFETHVTAGLAALERDPQTAAAEIERGLSVYRGDFLADSPYADWAMLERHRLHSLACMGLRDLAGIRLEARMIDSAARALEQLAALQPYDEEVHRQLMELDIMCGRRSDAVRRYVALRTRIRRTFGHDPDFTPADLASPER